MGKSGIKCRVGLLPLMADLYRRLVPVLESKIENFVRDIIADLADENLEIVSSCVTCTSEEIQRATLDFETQDVDLLVVAHTSYCASGEILPALLKTDLPVLLWPAQSMLELAGDKYDSPTVMLNHGVHGTQDLANVLRKNGRAFGLLHGHHLQSDFKDAFVGWARAGKAICEMKKSQPTMLGGHFENMLDLQIDDSQFLKKIGVSEQAISIDEFVSAAGNVSGADVAAKIAEYREMFVIGEGVSDVLFEKTARHELGLRRLLEQYGSKAVGINFQTLCNDVRVGDGLHVAACMLMREGFGYGGEGDWVTAMLNRGLQAAMGGTSFSEIFSVGYADNRLVLRHWGEGNFELARSKPIMSGSKFVDENSAEFAAVSFEFVSGRATLVNINASPDGNGQLITMRGNIEEELLSAVDGPRGIFKADASDVRDVLTEYDYQGGSHHSVLVMGDVERTIGNIARLTGWLHIRI